MGKTIELVRQEVAAMRGEVKDFANSAERVGGVVSDVLEYGHEQLTDGKNKHEALAERVTVAEGAISAEVERAQSAEELINQQAEQNFRNFSELGVSESAKIDGYEIALTKKTNTAGKTKVKVPVYNTQDPSKTPVGLVDEIFVEDMRAEAKEMVDAEAERAQSAEGEIRGSVESLGEDLNAASEDIGKLEAALETETSRAKEAEQALSVEITEAENRVDERVTEVRDGLDAEVQARSAAVADLREKNLIIYTNFDLVPIRIMPDNTLTNDDALSVIIPVKKGDTLHQYSGVIEADGRGVQSYYAFLKDKGNIAEGLTPNYSDIIYGRQFVHASKQISVEVPSDANYVIIVLRINGENYWRPTQVYINDIDLYGGILNAVWENRRSINFVKQLINSNTTDINSNTTAINSTSTIIRLEHGSYDVNHTEIGTELLPVNQSNRARSNIILNPFRLTLNDGYLIRTVVYLDENKKFLSYITGLNTNTVLTETEKGVYAAVILQKKGEEEITDISNIVKRYNYDITPKVYEEIDASKNYLSLNHNIISLKNGTYDLYAEEGEALKITQNAKRVITNIVKTPCTISINEGYTIRTIVHLDENKGFLSYTYRPSANTTNIEKIGEEYPYAAFILQKGNSGEEDLTYEEIKFLFINDSEMARIQSHTTVNRDYPKLAEGSINIETGQEEGSNRRLRTDFIGINEISACGIENEDNYRYFIRNYDENYNYIGYKNNLSPRKAKATVLDITEGTTNLGIDAINTAYIRITLRAEPDDIISITGNENVIYIDKIDKGTSFIDFRNIPYLNDDNHKRCIRLETEYGGLNTSTGEIEDASARENFFKKYRTPFYKVKPISFSSDGCDVSIYEYDANFTLINIYRTTEYIPSKDARYIKISGNVLTTGYNVYAHTDEISSVKNNRVSDNAISFVYRVNVAEGRSVESSELNISLYNDDMYYNTGILRLPPSYRENGKPTRMIMFAHGSGWYHYIGHSDFNPNYIPYIEYLQKEGYAVFDCYGGSSKYLNVMAMGTPTNMSCIYSAYKWIIKNYNIANDGIYVTGKSLGGIICANMISQKIIPVLACCPLAPELDARQIQLGYSANVRKFYCEDMGFVNYDAIIGTSQDNPLNNETYNELLNDNCEKLIGYSVLSNVISDNILTLGSIRLINDAFGSLKKISYCPIKIFIAADDSAVSYKASLNFVKSIRNAGGVAEIRRMPDGTGGHHAVDYDDNALKVSEIVTDLGYTCENIPLAWVEMVHFFKIN